VFDSIKLILVRSWLMSHLPQRVLVELRDTLAGKEKWINLLVNSQSGDVP
jgi:hypothetical protein